MNIEIEKGIPVPAKPKERGDMARLRGALSGMNIGDSFIWGENKHPFAAALQVGAKIKTQKQIKGGYRVWRVA